MGKSGGKIENGFDYWFPFVTHSVLRRPITERKGLKSLSMSSNGRSWEHLRNRKGTSIHERIMTVLATWAQQGLGQSSDDEDETEWLNTYHKVKDGMV